MRDGVGDVFKVHRFSLDEDADCDDGVEGRFEDGWLRVLFSVGGDGGGGARGEVFRADDAGGRGQDGTGY